MTKPIEVTIPNLSVRLSEQRKAEGVAWYIPHPGQEPFHECDSVERWVFGGNRSGKTESGAAEFIMIIRGSQRYRSRKIVRKGTAWAVSESSEIQREVIQPKILKWLPKGDIQKTQFIQRGIIDFILLKSGWRIVFKNYEQGVDKFGGKDVDIVWFDEEPPQDIYKECLMRTIDRGGLIVGTMTPVNGMTWIYQDIWEKNGERGISCFLMSMEENPYLGKKEKDRVLAGLTVAERKIRQEGKFIALHGLVYPQFSETKHVIEPFDVPSDWRTIIAVDPHLKKPTSVLWGAVAGYNYKGISKGDWVIFNELRRDGVIPDIVASILVANGRRRIFARIADPALNIKKDNITGVSPFDEFAAQGFPLMPANKKVESGIYEVRKLLDENPSGVWIFNTCIGLTWEFRHYSFNDIETDARKPYSEKIHKRDDDYMDCLRYMINTGFGPARSGMPVGEPVYTETGRLKGVR